MLFKEIHLKGIKAGSISLAYRKWGKLSLQIGAKLKTSIGLVEVISIEVIKESDITENDINNAGFESRAKFFKELNRSTSGCIYKIGVRYHSEDPRIKLREQEELETAEYMKIKTTLDKFDKSTKLGAWTRKVLLAINNHPHKSGMEIAIATGFEKEWLKLKIRKLKNLGLTMSHHVGYEVSPFGKKFIHQLKTENNMSLGIFNKETTSIGSGSGKSGSNQ